MITPGRLVSALPTAFVAVITLLAVAAPQARAADPAGAPRDPQAMWDKLCKSCHGADGKGVAAKAATLKIDPALLDLGRAGTEKMTREERKTQLLEGKDKMPAYKTKLKPEEIDPLLDLAEKIMVEARKGRSQTGAAPTPASVKTEAPMATQAPVKTAAPSPTPATTDAAPTATPAKTGSSATTPTKSGAPTPAPAASESATPSPAPTTTSETAAPAPTSSLSATAPTPESEPTTPAPSSCFLF